MALYLYGTAQPHMADVDIYPSHLTSQLTRQEKRAFADSVATHEAGFVPVCIDHAGAENGAGEPGKFQVPGELQIGRTVLAGVRPTGDLMTGVEIFFDRPEARAVAEGIRDRKEKWGFSLCTNLKLSPDGTRIIDKRVTHIGLTRDPEFANDGTGSRVNAAYLSWQSMDEHFQRDFLDREPGYYLHPAARERLNERLARVQTERLAETVPAAAAPMASSSSSSPHTLVQVTATRGTVPLQFCNLAPHLVTPDSGAGTSHSPVSYPPPAVMSSSDATLPASAPATPAATGTVASTAITPAPTTTAASTTTSPAVVVDYQSKLQGLNAEVDGRFANLIQGKVPTLDDELSVAQMDAAASFLEKYDAVMKQSGLTTAKTPYDTNRRLMLLQQYIEIGKEAMRKHRADIASASLDPMDLDMGNKAGEMWNEVPLAHTWAQEVIASHNRNIRNQRQWDAQFRAKAAEIEVKTKELESLKRDRDTFETQNKSLLERVDAMEKRSKVEVPVAAVVASPLMAAPAAVDVGASRSTAEPEAGKTWASLTFGNGIWKSMGDARTQAMADAYKTDKRVSEMFQGIQQAIAGGQKMFKILDK